MKLHLTPIKPKRISDQVFEQLRELIFRGELKPGQQLTPERELASAMDVSRTSVRDAINKLVVMGFLEHKQGQGTFVRSRDSIENNPFALAMETQDATLEDLLEVRMGLECNAAALAAQRAVDKDIHFLEKSIRDMKEEVDSGRMGTEADVSFHMAISYATKNPFQIYMMKNFYDYLFIGIKENLHHLYQDPANIAEIIRQHREILETIRRHDPQQAKNAMEQHIHFVLTFFRNAPKRS